MDTSVITDCGTFDSSWEYSVNWLAKTSKERHLTNCPIVMKVAIVSVQTVFSSGLQGVARVENSEKLLDAIRSIKNSSEELDIRLYQVEDQVINTNWAECFITDKIFEIRGQKPVGYRFLCNLTPQRK